MREKKVMKLASRGKRFGAGCIDAVVPVLSTLIFLIALIALTVTIQSYNRFGNGFGDPYQNFGYGYGYGYDSRPMGGIIAAIFIPIILTVIYSVVQIVFFTKSKTIGKAALGLQVVSSENGEPIGFWKMLFREWFVKSASCTVFMLGFIWILIDDKNRGWHDKILDTYVVDLRETEQLIISQRNRNRASASYTHKPVNTSPVGEIIDALDDSPVVTADADQTLEDKQADPVIRESVLDIATEVVRTAQDAAASARTEYYAGDETGE